MTSPFDPAQGRIVAAIKLAPTVDLKTLPIAQARALFEQGQALWAAELHPVADVSDIEVPGAAGSMPARLYRPAREGAAPVVLYAHGGGWTFGSIATHDGLMRSLAALSGCAVLGIDYRLAPENPFPAPLEDVLSALAFVEKGGLGPTFDAGRIAVGGDSAGATLALGALLSRRDAGGPMPRTAALFYGCYAPLFDTPSHRRNGDGSFLLTTANMEWYWRNFLGGSTAAPPALAAPLQAPLHGLPPLYLNAASLDPLLDDTTLLVQRLAEAGVRHRFDCWPGVVHGFLRFARDLPLAVAAIEAAAHFLKAELER